MPDEKTKVQLASVELETRQYRSRGPDHLWDLIASVNFTETEVPTSHGVLKLSINSANLRLDFDRCEMSQGDAGYTRHAPENREFLVMEETEKRGETGGKAGGRFSFNLKRGVDLSAEAEGNMATDVKTGRKESTKYSEIHNLVTFSKKEPGSNAMEWIIENVDEKKGLFGAVIHERDSQGGRLGTLKSRAKGGWAIQPIVTFQPQAEIVNEQELTAATQTKITAAKLMNQKETGRKLGIISALIGSELEHVALTPLVMPNEEDDQ